MQGPSLRKADIDELAAKLHTPARKITDQAVRFSGVEKDVSLAFWFEEKQLDHAWIPEGRRFADLKLLAMDMDSTLITIECIDELAAMRGIGEQVAAITAQAMRGEIDYAESLRQRVGLLAGVPQETL